MRLKHWVTILLLAPGATIARAEAPPSYLGQWGTLGTGDGQFLAPADVAVDAQGHIYVGDFHNHRVQKFDSHGNFLTKWGSPGSGDGQFAGALGVAIGLHGE